MSLIQTGGEFLTDSTSLQLQNDITLQSEAGITFSSLDLQTNTSLTSDSKISINSLELNQSSLTLGTADTELEIQGLLQLDDPNQKLIIGGSNLDLKNGVSISAGEISSTGGTVSIEKSVNLSGGTISITSGTLALGENSPKPEEICLWSIAL